MTERKRRPPPRGGIAPGVKDMGFENLDHTYQAMFRVYGTWGEDMFGLIGRRMQAYTELPGRIAGCAGLNELAALQTEFFQTMVADYTNHATHLAEHFGASATEDRAEPTPKAEDPPAAVPEAGTDAAELDPEPMKKAA